jgi:hypothetical protein
VAIPGSAEDPERVAQRLHRPSGTLDLLQLGIGKEGDVPAVWRPERIGGAVGPG